MEILLQLPQLKNYSEVASILRCRRWRRCVDLSQWLSSTSAGAGTGSCRVTVSGYLQLY